MAPSRHNGMRSGQTRHFSGAVMRADPHGSGFADGVLGSLFGGRSRRAGSWDRARPDSGRGARARGEAGARPRSAADAAAAQRAAERAKSESAGAMPGYPVIRFRLISACVILGLLIISGWLFWRQVNDSLMLRTQGDMRALRTQTVMNDRGIIMDRNGEKLAVSVPVRSVWADGKEIAEGGSLENASGIKNLAEVLSETTGMTEEELRQKLSDPKRRHVYLARQLSDSYGKYIESLGIPGIHVSRETRRFYPTGEISAQLIGFTDIDGIGLEGIENSYNDWLSGSPTKVQVIRDRKGHVLEDLGVVRQGEKAHDIYLSIDSRLQAVAYRSLKYAQEYHDAVSASLVLVDVKTGEILAMVNSPSFNPNLKSKPDGGQTKNRTVTDTYEPGSTVKPIIAVSALEHHATDWKEVFDTRPFGIGGKIITDSHHMASGNLSEILKFSSNIGMARIALRMNASDMVDTLNSFGLGELQNTGLIGEVDGMVPHRSRWSDIERATLGFGYGLRITPVQLACAYTTIANRGIRKPLSLLRVDEPPKGERIADERIMDNIARSLETVVEGGTGGKAGVPGYSVAGKTGTAKVAVAGGYGKDYVGTFAGFAPVDHPRFAMVVIVNQPHKNGFYGGVVSGPVFSDVMSTALQLYNIPPDRLPENEKGGRPESVRVARNGSTK